MVWRGGGGEAGGEGWGEEGGRREVGDWDGMDWRGDGGEVGVKEGGGGVV